MKTIWFCGEDENKLTLIAEGVGEELINRDQFVELIVHSEVKEILGKGLKDTEEDKSIFTDRLGFLGHLLHKNNIFALIVSHDSKLEDRKKVKDDYKNYVQINLEKKDSLTDILLEISSESKLQAKKIIEYLISEKTIPEKQGSNVYSKEEEEEIRRRLEELGYV